MLETKAIKLIRKQQRNCGDIRMFCNTKAHTHKIEHVHSPTHNTHMHMHTQTQYTKKTTTKNNAPHAHEHSHAHAHTNTNHTVRTRTRVLPGNGDIEGKRWVFETN